MIMCDRSGDYFKPEYLAQAAEAAMDINCDQHPEDCIWRANGDILYPDAPIYELTFSRFKHIVPSYEKRKKGLAKYEFLTNEEQFHCEEPPLKHTWVDCMRYHEKTIDMDGFLNPNFAGLDLEFDAPHY